MIIVHGIPNCDTVKKSRAWLEAHNVPYRFHDLKKDGMPAELLDQWLGTLGWERVVNRRGTTWRKLDAATQAGVVDAASARAVMLREPSLIKRPVVAWPGTTTVGFDEAEWASLIAA